jgi:DNA-binding transcriptional LysR family regulator
VFGRTLELRRNLQLGEIDLVISRLGIADDQPDIRAVKAYDVGDIIIARNDHPYAGRDDVALADLIEFPWILPPPNNPFRKYLEGLFYHEGLPLPSNVFEIASMFAARELLVESDEIVCTLPSMSLRDDLEKGSLIQLNVPIPLNPPPVGVLHKRDPLMERYCDELVRALQEGMPRLPAALSDGPS